MTGQIPRKHYLDMEEPNGVQKEKYQISTAYFVELLEMVRSIETKLNHLEDRVNNRMVTRAEFAVQTKIVCETKVIARKLQASLVRITGEKRDPVMDEIASAVPLTSVAAVYEVEEKLQIYCSMIIACLYVFKTSYILKVKGVSDDVDTVIDDVLAGFNYDGIVNRRSVGSLTLVAKIISVIFTISTIIQNV